MLIGEYTHTLDEKKRVSLPAKFRQELGKKLIITRGLDTCLWVCDKTEWQKLFENVSKVGVGLAGKRDIDRFLLASASEVEVDGAGRFLIPENLKGFAGLKNRIVFAGLGNRVEVWDEKRWIEAMKRIEKQADVLAEKLGEVGAL